MDDATVGVIRGLKEEFTAGICSTRDDSQCHSSMTIDVYTPNKSVDVDYDQDVDDDSEEVNYDDDYYYAEYSIYTDDNTYS